MPAVQQHRQSHKRSTELTVSCLGLSKKQVFLFKFGSFGLVTGARIEAPEGAANVWISKARCQGLSDGAAVCPGMGIFYQQSIYILLVKGFGYNFI